jgi:hypothetical protein
MPDLFFVFVHGTGVRGDAYSRTFASIQSRLDGLKLIDCRWGDRFGAKLQAEGASIPAYDTTKSLGQVDSEDAEVLVWGMLFEDPLYELRTLALTASAGPGIRFGERPVGSLLHSKLEKFVAPQELGPALDSGEITARFDQARIALLKEGVYLDAVNSGAASIGETRLAVARALVASAIALELTTGGTPRAVLNPDVRRRITALVEDALGGQAKGLAGWTAKQLAGLALRMGALNFTTRKRGAVSDAVFPASGDILVYQANGDPIRNCIADAISKAECSPVVLLSHSLGGVACVDLLIARQFNNVKLLVTAGSQAPYFYELGALRNLQFPHPLPDDFPAWLNLYDRRDLLAYIGRGVFGTKVEDVPVDNLLPFPYCHSAYWENSHTWQEIRARLPAH